MPIPKSLGFMGNRAVYYLTEVKLFDASTGVAPIDAGSIRAPEIQILRVGTFKHPDYGIFSITPATLSEMKANFEAKVRGVDIAVDYFHDEDKIAAGWFKELFLSGDGQELWAKVDWTPRARKMLAEKELRYFSPEFQFTWENPETGAKHQNVLFGGGLTNRPFIKEMAPIVELTENSKGDTVDEKEFKELQEKNVKLTEELAVAQKGIADMQAAAPAKEEELTNLKKQLADMQTECERLKGENEKMLAEKAEAEKAKALAEKEGKFNIMLSEGKVCEAQRKAFLGDDMAEFVANARPINLAETGNGAGTKEVVAGETDETKLIKLAEERAEKEKVSFKVAMAAVIRESKK